MPELTYRAAVAAGIAQEMRRDQSVVFVGEDVGAAGGVFKTTEGLLAEFGAERVRDTSISEQGRAPVRRPAQPERRELGDGDPRPQGRGPLEPGRRRRPHGGRYPRP